MAIDHECIYCGGDGRIERRSDKAMVKCPCQSERESGEVLSMLKKYRVAASRMCSRWAEGDQAVKDELWKSLHALESDALEIIERAEKVGP